MAILATGVLSPALQDAYVLKTDNSNKLSSKAFGEKTKTKLTSDDSQKTQQSGFEGVKKEQAKTYKKTMEQYKASKIMKTIYRLG